MSGVAKAIAYYALNRWVMRLPSHTARLLVLRRFLRQVGRGCTFLMDCEIKNGGNVIIGVNCVFNNRVLLDGRGGEIVIGDNVDIAREVSVWTLQHDVDDAEHGTVGGGVTIEDHVWIGSRVTILPGVRIGRGAVVASGAVVTRDVPPMTVVAGVPAAPIRTRRNNLQYTLKFRPLFQ
jgi:acetyltransferase-like isoleucine patch superfamily enzyme